MSIDRIKNFLSKVVKKSDNGRQHTRSFVAYEGSRGLIGGKADTSPLTPEKVQQYIEEFLPVRKEEKDKFGEVFTPQSLINEMLDKLPKNVWSDPTLKWLDPANGIGNFPMVAFVRLDKGLSNVEGFKDKTVRQKHIIQNMLYMVELNPKNVGVSRRIFGKDANIYCGSFLESSSRTTDGNSRAPPSHTEDGWKRKFGVDKFDVIMGNPPFNNEKKGKQIGSRAKNSLWDKFIFKSLDVLNKNGFLTFINPAQWRGLGPEYHKIWEILSKKQLLYLHIFGEKDGKKYFNVGSRFDVYVLQNKENTKATEVIDELGETHLLELNKMPFLPNYAYKEINKILTTEDKGIDVIYDYFYANTSKIIVYNKKLDFVYPVVHSITQDGLKFLYTNNNTKGHFGVPKVILNFNRHQYSHPEQNDYEGKYGMSQISFGIPIKSKREGDLILKAIQTPVFKKIIAATKWGAFQTDYRMFKYFKPDWYKIILQEQAKQDQKGGNKRYTRKISKNHRISKPKTRKYKVQRNKRNTRKKKLVQRRKTRKNKSRN